MALMQAAEPNSQQSTSSDAQISLCEKIFSHKIAPFAITGFFVVALLLWSRLDFSIPTHDAANHSNYSSLVEQWLCRPRGWNADSLKQILTLMPNYPAGSWFFNAFCKMIVGNSRFSEQIILCVHLCILNFAVWQCGMFMLKDRFKSSLSIFLLNCCPIFLVLEHSPLIDLQQTAVFMLFFLCFLRWWQVKSWKRTLALALVFGFYCLSKQIAILYAAPALVVAGLLCLYQRRWGAVAQLVSVAACAAIMLLSWVLPNWTYLFAYSHERGAFASQHMGMFASILSNFKESFLLVLQGLSWPVSAFFAGISNNLRKSDIQAFSSLLIATIGGAILISIIAYYNVPEARYYAPVVVAICLCCGAAAANLVRSFKGAEIAVVPALALFLLQAQLLCFQPLPPANSADELLKQAQYKVSGVREVNMLEHLPYVPKGDPWKQRWIFDVIETADPGRPVYLNCLSNSKPFNLGTLAFVAKQRKSKVKVTTWRGIGADISDTFAYTDESLHYMHWVVEKTGDEKLKFFDSGSQSNYCAVLDKLSNGGHFVVAGRQPLPDGTQLIVYRNRDWMAP